MDTMLKIFLVLSCLWLIWLALYLSRYSILSWIIRRLASRKEMSKANTILMEARSERWITMTQEADLRNKYKIAGPEALQPDPPARTPRQYLADLIHFYFPRRRHD